MDKEIIFYLDRIGLGHIQFTGQVQVHSRNTSIVMGTLDGERVIVKYSRLLKNSAHREFRAYEALTNVVHLSAFGSPRPIAYSDEGGLIVTEFIPGESLSSVLQLLQGSGKEVDYQNLLEYIAFFGEALRCFHENSVSHPSNGTVRQYLDFSPSNLIVGNTSQLYLIDPPGEEAFDIAERDIGVTMFELVRTALHWKSFRGIKRLPQIRRTFIKGYRLDGEQTSAAINLEAVHGYEYAHIFAVIKRYMQFYKYPDWIWQFTRALVYIPSLLLLSVSLFRFLHWRDLRGLAGSSATE